MKTMVHDNACDISMTVTLSDLYFLFAWVSYQISGYR